MAQAAGIAALEDREFLHRALETNARGMHFLAKAFREMGLETIHSEANFVMIVLPSVERAAQTTHDLLAQGIIIRPLDTFGLPQCIRVSTGTDEENERCVEAMHKLAAAVP
jgi:histidinol-phosphate aminotransferase